MRRQCFISSRSIREKLPHAPFAGIVTDVCDEGRIAAIFSERATQIVFHAAAYKHVPVMEEKPLEAIKNNIFGTLSVARASIGHAAENSFSSRLTRRSDRSQSWVAPNASGRMLWRRAPRNRAGQNLILRRALW